MLRPIRISDISGCFTLFLLTATPLASGSIVLSNPVGQLSQKEQLTLKNGQPVIIGEKGKYIARVLVSTSVDTAWSVLTDYGNTSKFIPHVISSKVIRANGNQKVIEQVDVRQVLFVSTRSRVRSAITETAKTRIDFQAIEGDLKSMKGYWQLAPMPSVSGVATRQILITQVVEVQPKGGTPSGIFYSIFKSSLGDIMNATRKEMERRN
jgi:ribosome-associated toxin RatA of RatAB toxin-antitoxin module